MIDKNGKLFGKINVIDLLVLVVLVAAILVVGLRFIGPRGDATETLEMKFYIEEVNDWVADKIQIGDTMYDGTNSMTLGKVTAVEKGKAETWAITEDGRYVVAEREGFCSLVVTGDVQGKKTDTGAEIGGEIYGVGHSMVLHAGDAKMYLRVYDISQKAE